MDNSSFEHTVRDGVVKLSMLNFHLCYIRKLLYYSYNYHYDRYHIYQNLNDNLDYYDDNDDSHYLLEDNVFYKAQYITIFWHKIVFI